MSLELWKGLLIPFAGTTLGAACVFFMRNTLSSLVQRALTGFAAGDMVAVLSSRRRRVLAGHSVPAGAGPAHPPPPPGQHRGRGAQKQPEAHHHAHPGRGPAQYPGGDGGGRGLRGLAVWKQRHHPGRGADPLPGHRHSELPGGGHHLHAPEGRGPVQAPGLPLRHFVRRGRAPGGSLDHSHGRSAAAGAALRSELCRRGHDLRGGGGADRVFCFAKICPLIPGRRWQVRR